jgi:hypothetical protein
MKAAMGREALKVRQKGSRHTVGLAAVMYLSQGLAAVQVGRVTSLQSQG